jgi:DNA-binding transcriptional ArsR family regulator
MDGGANTGYRQLLQVAADPNRWRILALISSRPLTVGELVTRLDVAQPSVSHHLARLREIGLVESVAEGRSRRYGWATALPGSVQAEVHNSLRRWMAGPLAENETGSRKSMAPGPIEVHLL